MSGFDCLLFPSGHDYYSLRHRPQHLLTALSELGVEVFYMNPPLQAHLPTDVKHINPFFHLLTGGSPPSYLIGRNPVVYFLLPEQIERMQQYQPYLSILDTAHTPVTAFTQVSPNYRDALGKADIVLTASEALYQQARIFNTNTHLLENACDFPYFHQAVDQALPIPSAVENLEGPFIGYIGNIANWLDYALIESIADYFSHAQLLMIGPVHDIQDVPQRPNLHWLGFCPYDQLINYVQLFDVAIIPFINNPQVQSVNPIKMWEYLAAGKLVVSSMDADVNQKYSHIVYHGLTPKDFITAVAQCLQYPDPIRQVQGIELARVNTWVDRARQTLSIIQQSLPRQPKPKARQSRIGLRSVLAQIKLS